MNKIDSRHADTSRAHAPAKPRRDLYPDARATSRRRHRAAKRAHGWLLKPILFALALSLAAALSAAAQGGGIKEVGVGVIAGDPIGGTAKLWLDNDFAVDIGVGFSGDAVFWGDILYHMWNILPQPAEGKLGVYVGAGPRLEARNDAEFAVRTIAGVNWRVTRQPIELFAEAGPVFRMTPHGGVDADGGIGVRFYFGSR